MVISVEMVWVIQTRKRQRLLRNPNVPTAISKDMQAVKHYSIKILQFFH